MIKKSMKIRKSRKEIEKYFEKTAKNPGSYTFDTHGGLFPLEDNFTKPGKKFKTKEIFFLFPIELTFETVEKTNDKFKFQLIKPFKALKLMGEYSMRTLDKNTSEISLSIYTRGNKWLNFPFFIPPIRNMIAKQIGKELQFVAKNI